MEHLESLGPHEKGKIYKLQAQEKEKFHANEIENNFNKITGENTSNLRKEVSVQTQEAHRTPKIQNWKKNPLPIYY